MNLAKICLQENNSHYFFKHYNKIINQISMIIIAEGIFVSLDKGNDAGGINNGK